MIEGVHKVRVSIDKREHTADIHLFERIEKDVVNGFCITRRVERPMDFRAASLDLDMLVITVGDALVDLAEAGFKLLFECCQMILDGLLKDRKPGVRDQLVLVLPSL